MTALRDWAEHARRDARYGTASTWDAPPDADQIRLLLSAERQRVASALHDEVSPLLFGMTSHAGATLDRNARDPDELLAVIGHLAEQLRLTQDRLRAVITSCGPRSAEDALPVATQRDLDDFASRTGTATHLMRSGQAEYLAPAVERVALNCLRQALFNIERHASASVVVVTLDYRPDRLRLVVQDDGLGLPIGFEPRVVPTDGHHWGFTSMAEQVERLGGSVELRRVEEGGTQLRLQLPRHTSEGAS
jgi:signal transduction histidine kinase